MEVSALVSLSFMHPHSLFDVMNEKRLIRFNGKSLLILKIIESVFKRVEL